MDIVYTKKHMTETFMKGFKAGVESVTDNSVDQQTKNYRELLVKEIDLLVSDIKRSVSGFELNTNEGGTIWTNLHKLDSATGGFYKGYECIANGIINMDDVVEYIGDFKYYNDRADTIAKFSSDVMLRSLMYGFMNLTVMLSALWLADRDCIYNGLYKLTYEDAYSFIEEGNYLTIESIDGNTFSPDQYNIDFAESRILLDHES